VGMAALARAYGNFRNRFPKRCERPPCRALNLRQPWTVRPRSGFGSSFGWPILSRVVETARDSFLRVHQS
jgi:hypothetical protein